jgi:uncharacterized protein (DUF2267 family)
MVERIQEDTMNHDEFVGRVQHSTRLSSRGDAERAIRAVFETLGERLQMESADHIAAQLPPELGRHLRHHFFEHLSVSEFCQRVAHREYCDPEKAAFHTRCVMQTLRDAISPGAYAKIDRQLPREFARLMKFEVRAPAMELAEA